MDAISIIILIVVIFILVTIGVIIYFIYAEFTCSATLNIGDSCSRDCSCNNDACGRQTAADNAPLICCPSNKTDGYLGFDYCTGMPDGSQCWSDAMCAGGTCEGNNGGLNKGICTGSGEPGQHCTSNDQCSNRACGRETAAEDAPLICCPSGNTDLYFGFDYCTEMPNGSVCWTSAMCESDYCKGNIIGLERGVCS